MKLNNGLTIPIVAFGTYNPNLNSVYEMVNKAIDIGYRHFDTASLYKNEQQVGQAINDKLTQFKRSDFFLTSKLPMNGFAIDKVEYFLNKSLDNLKTDYLDLYLMHAPFATKYLSDEQFYPVDQNGLLIPDDTDFVNTWKCLEKIYKDGKVKSIGVSNFNIKQLQRILDNCEIKPMVHQIEVHVFFQNVELIKFCKEKKIQVSSFAALASPKKCPSDYLLENNETIKELCKKYSKTWTQICLRFLIQQDIVVIPGADNEIQLKENLDCNTFSLNDEDMIKLTKLNKKRRIFTHNYEKGYLQ